MTHAEERQHDSKGFSIGRFYHINIIHALSVSFIKDI